ncbi:unnamed protein product [Brugia pahangi]|uniref:C2H2-type domain-containing protein n=1 Tax=Brugia pahangi TaxID=6280 RepID=A0A0N4T361_BRUPA|nr:unnamed protein product [Brugia pahangi]
MVTKDYKEYVAHRKAHGQPFIYECRVPGCGRGHSIVNHHFTITSKRMNLITNASAVANSSIPGMGYKNTRSTAQQNFSFLGELNYECLYPGYAVIRKNYIEYLTHKETHDQPFIYECKVPGCGRTFDYKSSFRSHEETHERRCQCEGYCKFFYRMSALKFHKKLCSRAPR